MRAFILALLLLGCGEEVLEFKHSTESLIGTWKLDKIESGYGALDCKNSQKLAVVIISYIYLMDNDSSGLKLQCYPSYNYNSSWVKTPRGIDIKLERSYLKVEFVRQERDLIGCKFIGLDPNTIYYFVRN